MGFGFFLFFFCFFLQKQLHFNNKTSLKTNTIIVTRAQCIFSWDRYPVETRTTPKK